MKRVLIFGSFDPLHEGHVNFMGQAKALGEHLTVVVAHDSALRAHKGREPHEPDKLRLQKVVAVPYVDRALIGNKQANKYDLLDELEYEVIALGYDQEPGDEKVREELDKIRRPDVEIVRLKAYKPDQFKSSLLRDV